MLFQNFLIFIISQKSKCSLSLPLSLYLRSGNDLDRLTISRWTLPGWCRRSISAMPQSARFRHEDSAQPWGSIHLILLHHSNTVQIHIVLRYLKKTCAVTSYVCVSHRLGEEFSDLVCILDHPLSSAHLLLPAPHLHLHRPPYVLKNHILMEER